jgi:hypothetical protein
MPLSLSVCPCVAAAIAVDRVALDVRTDAVALWVMVESPLAGRWDDNGFFLLPGEARTLVFQAAQAVDLDEFSATLVVRSYSDVLP